MQIPRDKKEDTSANLLTTGDLVIGSSNPDKSVYSPGGSRLNGEGVFIHGDAKDIEARQQMILKSALGQGGELVEEKPTKGKKQRSKKVPNIQRVSRAPYEDVYNPDFEEIPEPEPEVILQTVQFENGFGRIKSKVEHIVDQETALMLVFTNEDAVVFEPKVGEKLALHLPDRSQVEVYYPGVKFNYPGTDKELMILFKVPEGIEEEE